MMALTDSSETNLLTLRGISPPEVNRVWGIGGFYVHFGQFQVLSQKVTGSFWKSSRHNPTNP